MVTNYWVSALSASLYSLWFKPFHPRFHWPFKTTENTLAFRWGQRCLGINHTLQWMFICSLHSLQTTRNGWKFSLNIRPTTAKIKTVQNHTDIWILDEYKQHELRAMNFKLLYPPFLITRYLFEFLLFMSIHQNASTFSTYKRNS